jgi:hypothetical protein
LCGLPWPGLLLSSLLSMVLRLLAAGSNYFGRGCVDFFRLLLDDFCRGIVPRKFNIEVQFL